MLFLFIKVSAQSFDYNWINTLSLPPSLCLFLTDLFYSVSVYIAYLCRDRQFQVSIESHSLRLVLNLLIKIELILSLSFYLTFFYSLSVYIAYLCRDRLFQVSIESHSLRLVLNFWLQYRISTLFFPFFLFFVLFCRVYTHSSHTLSSLFCHFKSHIKSAWS